jgi:hypothetical protein
MKDHGFYILCLVFLLAACNDTDSDQNSSYRFYVEYTNHAWGFDHRGLFINDSGEVYSYQLEQIPDLERDNSYTEQELDNLFAQNQAYLMTLESSEFSSMVSMSERVETDHLTDPENNCFDAGIYRYSTFDYNKDTGVYSDILLYQTGDWRIVNNDANAIAVRDWLIALALEYNFLTHRESAVLSIDDIDAAAAFTTATRVVDSVGADIGSTAP